MPKTVDLQSFYKNLIKGGPMLFGHQFIVRFTGNDLPSVLKSDPSKAKSFTYYVKSTSIPKIEIDEAKVNFLSQDFVVPKNIKYDGSWKTNVLLDQNIQHYHSLYDWQEQFASLKNSGGGLKVIPDVNAIVSLTDSSFKTILHEFVLVGVYPTDIPDLSMQYENNANLVDFSCTFVYQYMYDDEYGNPFSTDKG